MRAGCICINDLFQAPGNVVDCSIQPQDRVTNIRLDLGSDNDWLTSTTSDSGANLRSLVMKNSPFFCILGSKVYVSMAYSDIGIVLTRTWVFHRSGLVEQCWVAYFSHLFAFFEPLVFVKDTSFGLACLSLCIVSWTWRYDVLCSFESRGGWAKVYVLWCLLDFWLLHHIMAWTRCRLIRFWVTITVVCLYWTRLLAELVQSAEYGFARFRPTLHSAWVCTQWGFWVLLWHAALLL